MKPPINLVANVPFATPPPPFRKFTILKRFAAFLILGLTAEVAVAQSPATFCATQATQSQPNPTPRTLPAPAPAPAPANGQTPCFSIQNVRVNIHFMLTDDGRGNFTETNDGFPGNPSTALTGYDYAASLIYACNGRWDVNPALNIAPGSTLTPLPTRIRLSLNGVYFHRKTSLQTFSNGINSSLTPYLVDAGNTINIFMAELAPEACKTNVNTGVTTCGFPGIQQTNNQWLASGTSNGGVANVIGDASNYYDSKYTCIRGAWTNYVQANQQSWQIASTVNHEVGHLLGLDHTWYPVNYTTQKIARGYADCADAPLNANCWNLNSPPGPSCDQLFKVSNNLMDYNAGSCSLSPCQIGIIQRNLGYMGRFVVNCGPCVAPGLSLRMPAVTCGRTTNIWLDGQGSWGDNYCDLKIERLDPQNAVLSTYTTTLWQTWSVQKRLQLDALTVFQANARYRVTVGAHNNCDKSVVISQSLIFSTGSDATCISTPPAPAIFVSPSVQPPTPR